MAEMNVKAGGFDPDVGILPIREGWREIGRANLPLSTGIIPGSEADAPHPGAWLFGRLSDSAITDQLRRWLTPELRRRELLSPDVFFAELATATEAFTRAARSRSRDGSGSESGSKDEYNAEDGNKDGDEGGPLAAASDELRRILADRELCEALRSLVMQA